MFRGLYDIDWSSMEHAYGSAAEVPGLLLALRSPDGEERRKALVRFYSAVHHQGVVVPCTTASLPFLFELAGDVAAHDRAAIVDLLVSIGTAAVEECENQYADLVDFAGAAAVVRERAEVFVGFASDADPRVRRAAIPGLALFLDDTDRAAAVLRDRLSAEPETAERLLVVDAMATLALRVPALSDGAMAWFDELAADTTRDPGTRLAAVVQQARCAPEQISEDTVPAAIDLLREMANATVTDGERPAPAPHVTPTTPEAPAAGVAPQVVAAFEDLDRKGLVHAPTTHLLRTFHETLAARVSQRTALLAQQLRTPDPGSRLDAIRMSAELMKSWRGDHTSLILQVSEHLGATEHEVAAEAAAVLEECHAIAEPARGALAAHVAAHGPDAWAAPNSEQRRAHQEAVRALARLGDARAVPSVLAALDSGVDAWRAVEVAGALIEAADHLVPRLCAHLRRVDHTQQWLGSSAAALLSALGDLRDQAALPSIIDTLAAAVRHDQAGTTSSALKALATFGPAAAPALETIRPLTAASDAHVRPDAVAALWAIGGDREEVMPLLGELLTGRPFFWKTRAADVLAEIGPPAVAALPQLRQLLTDRYDWVRIHGAAAVWTIGGEAETSIVLDILLQAWSQNPATGDHIVAFLDRMGLAAEPALPQVRSELTLPRRNARFASIRRDEELQRVCHAIIGRLS
ncbi:hypothetical protein ACTMTF_20520 [Nonomuraea sp. ZG12]|uniref:hypothetical protein n=1 Tax=Nonomuraea sp. ZG12 TaxID=3452207 RepID=UPI003F8AD662